MIKRKTVLTASAFAFLAFCAWASDPWKNMDYEKWTSKDVDKILNNSPWAKSITVPYYPYLNGDRPETDQRIKIGSAKDSTGVAESSIYRPEGTFTLRWNSALTLRRALFREAVLRGLGTDYATQRFLINNEDSIVLTMIPTGQTLLPPTEPPTLRRETYLELQPSGLKIPATLAEVRSVVDARDNHGYVFFFPQRNADGTPTIPKDVKEIDFYTQVGLRRFQAKFRPAEMTIPDGVDYF